MRLLGGVHLCGGIVSALFQREQTGTGAVLDISDARLRIPHTDHSSWAYFLAENKKLELETDILVCLLRLIMFMRVKMVTLP